MSFRYEKDRGASTWKFVLEVCEKHDAALEEIIFPKEYTSDVSCRLRRAVLSDLWHNGWEISALMAVCPLSERTIRRALKKD